MKNNYSFQGGTNQPQIPMISHADMSELISSSRAFLAPVIYKGLVDTITIMYEFMDEKCCELVLETLPSFCDLSKRPIVAINAFLEGVNRLEYAGKYSLALREVYSVMGGTAVG